MKKKKCVLPSRGVREVKGSRGREAVSTESCLSPRLTSSSKCSPTSSPLPAGTGFRFFLPSGLDDSRRPEAARQWDAQLAAAPLRVSLQKVLECPVSMALGMHFSQTMTSSPLHDCRSLHAASRSYQGTTDLGSR